MRKSANQIRKESKDHSLIITSWHESGHIIIGLFNYFKVQSANIFPPWNDEGATCYLSINFNNVSKKLKQELLKFQLESIYAGQISEEKFHKEIAGSISSFSRGSSSMDNILATRLIQNHNLAKAGKARILLKKRVKKNLDKVLSKFWDSVRIIAHALYERRSLTFSDIKILLTTQTKHKKFWKNRFRVIEKVYK